MTKNLDAVVRSETERAQQAERQARQRLADAVAALKRTAAERDHWRRAAITARRALQQQHQRRNQPTTTTTAKDTR